MTPSFSRNSGNWPTQKISGFEIPCGDATRTSRLPGAASAEIAMRSARVSASTGLRRRLELKVSSFTRISVISCHTAALMGCFCSSCMRSRRVAASPPLIGRAWSTTVAVTPEPET